MLLVTSCYGNHRHKFWSDGPLGSYTDLTALKEKTKFDYFVAIVSKASFLSLGSWLSLD